MRLHALLLAELADSAFRKNSRGLKLNNTRNSESLSCKAHLAELKVLSR